MNGRGSEARGEQSNREEESIGRGKERRSEERRGDENERSKLITLSFQTLSNNKQRKLKSVLEGYLNILTNETCMNIR